MTDVTNRGAVVGAPEERNISERPVFAQHVFCHMLAVPLREHPMLYPDTRARPRIWPAGHVAGGINPRNSGFQFLIHQNATVDPRPAASARATRGFTPTPTMTRSASIAPPAFSVAVLSPISVIEFSRWKMTP